MIMMLCLSFSKFITSFTQSTANASSAAIPEHQLTLDNNSGGVIPSNHEISIAEGSANPSSTVFYDPLPATVKGGNSVIWINDNFIPYTATSGNPDNEEAPAGTLFDTGKGYSIYQRSQFVC
jgi:hypothetical protein